MKKVFCADCMRIFLRCAAVLFPLLFLFGCSEINEEYDSENKTITTSAVTTVSTVTTSTVTAMTSDEAPEVTTIAPVDTEFEEMKISDFSQSIEAENTSLCSGAYISSDDGNFSGDGYVDGFAFSTESGLEFELDMPSSQYYDFEFYFSSSIEDISKAHIFIGSSEYIIEIGMTEDFDAFALESVFVSQGKTTVRITGGYNDFCADKINIENSKLYRDFYFELDNEPCSPSYDENAEALYGFVCDNFLKRCMTGQYASSDANAELELIHEATGQYPLIRLGDLGCYSLNGGTMASNEIQASLDWAKRGGIVSLMWHWNAPTGNPSVYAAESPFDLKSAVSAADIAEMTDEELNVALEDGTISGDTFALIKDIDNISAQLAILRDAGVPVLWRPLHEAANGSFWWGASGPEAYISLWRLMFERMTEYHGLTNLIWIWNGQAESFYVGDDYFDIASVDVYTEVPDTSSQYRSFLLLYELTEGKKPLALSECSTAPAVESMLTDKAVWSFFGLWYGKYIADDFGRPNSAFNSRRYLMSIYNSTTSVVLGGVDGLFNS